MDRQGKILIMDQPRHLPDINRMSVVIATILLAYTLTRFVDLPARTLTLQLPGIFLEIKITVRTLIAVNIIALAVTGTDWILRDHPALGQKRTIQHWLLPALTAWGIGIPLSQLPLGAEWWIVFGIGGGLLALIMIAEFIIVDPDDIRHAPATIGLTAISFAFYLILAVALRAANVRLYVLLPTLTLAIGLVSLRTLNLRLHGDWAFAHAAVIALIIGQIISALHYWPLSPTSFGLAILGPSYALTSLAVGLVEGKTIRQIILEPILVLIVVWGVALWTS